MFCANISTITEVKRALPAEALAKAGRGVTANMLDLGSSDSGFESRRPEGSAKEQIYLLF